MKHKTIYNLLALAVLAATSCSSSDADPLAEPVPGMVLCEIPNGGFEDGVQSWTISGDLAAASIADGGCEGTHSLRLQAETAHEVGLKQTVSGLADGIYDLEFFYMSSGGQRACYLSAQSGAGDEKMTSLQSAPSVWTRSYVRGIKVEGGKCDIMIKVQADDAAWCRIDNLNLIKSDREFNLLKGGDISELTYVEQNGGKYYMDGKEGDCIDILKQNGMNIVRLRLYNDPGNANYSPSNRLPAGIQSSEDILRLAKRAKDAGMQILLTFHYSDYWTNGETQTKPHEWEGLGFEELKQALYDFTFSFMQRMKAQGTTPEYVAIGNETQAGMLYPDGSYENFAQLSELYNAGYDAVKAVSEDSKVIIHLNNAGSKDQYNWYLGELKDRGTRYDIIGASYYPYWTNLTASEMREWADYITAKFDKDIIIMETGYSWNRTLPDGSAGQLSHNGPYTDFSPLGQKNFMLELTNEIKKADGCRILGYFYWDPIFIEVPGIGWELGGKNYVSNTTLFDFDGNALETFDALKYNN